MAERPILFSAPMVRAILAGTKTQTRRVVKPTPQMVTNRTIQPWGGDAAALLGLLTQTGKSCPYGQPGDRLWVREAFRFTDPFDAESPSRVGERCLDAGYKTPWAPMQFEADKARQNWIDVGTPTFPPKDITAGKLRPGMFMPRWASRILLEITDVRVERLQDISDADVDAECFGGNYPEAVLPEIFPRREGGWGHLSMQQCFQRLWESINGDESWEANPWVWVVSFKRFQEAAHG